MVPAIHEADSGMLLAQRASPVGQVQEAKIIGEVSYGCDIKKVTTVGEYRD